MHADRPWKFKPYGAMQLTCMRDGSPPLFNHCRSWTDPTWRTSLLQNKESPLYHCWPINWVVPDYSTGGMRTNPFKSSVHWFVLLSWETACERRRGTTGAQPSGSKATVPRCWSFPLVDHQLQPFQWGVWWRVDLLWVLSTTAVVSHVPIWSIVISNVATKNFTSEVWSYIVGFEIWWKLVQLVDTVGGCEKHDSLA